MNLHLAQISRTVAPGVHAVVLMDQAGWHLTPKLELPANISIAPASRSYPAELCSFAGGCRVISG